MKSPQLICEVSECGNLGVTEAFAAAPQQCSLTWGFVFVINLTGLFISMTEKSLTLLCNK